MKYDAHRNKFCCFFSFSIFLCNPCCMTSSSLRWMRAMYADDNNIEINSWMFQCNLNKIQLTEQSTNEMITLKLDEVSTQQNWKTFLIEFCKESIACFPKHNPHFEIKILVHRLRYLRFSIFKQFQFAAAMPHTPINPHTLSWLCGEIFFLPACKICVPHSPASHPTFSLVFENVSPMFIKCPSGEQRKTKLDSRECLEFFFFPHFHASTFFHHHRRQTRNRFSFYPALSFFGNPRAQWWRVFVCNIKSRGCQRTDHIYLKSVMQWM